MVKSQPLTEDEFFCAPPGPRMKQAQFERVAQFEKARLHYERVREGLGQEFEAGVDAAVQRVKASPQMFRKAWLHYRRCLVERFPYAVIYEDLDEGVHIVAISNLHRHPDHWKSRV